MEAIRALIVMRQVRNEPDQAASLYHAALERDPKGIAAMIALSRLAQSQGDEGGAMSWLEKAVAVRPESLDVQMQVIALLATQNKAQKALASSEALARSAPDSPAVIAQLAQLQFAGGLREEGILSLRHLASLAAVNGQIELGQQLASFDLPAEALKSYRHATEIAPDNVNAWRSLVIAEARLTGLPSSLETVKRAFLHAAVAPYGNELKGEAYCAAGRTDDAESAFRAALKSKPESWLLLRLASCSVHSGDRTGEIAILADWLKAHPKDNIVRVAYASALMETQHNDAAIKEFQILLAADPVNVAVLNDLAWLQSGDGTANALHNAALAFGLAPQSPQVCDTLAWVLLQKGDLASAASLLRASHDVWPADPDITYHLAVALARHGDIGGARLLVKPLADSKIAFASRDDAKLLAQSLSSAQE
jgi:tetratricopeptide (TPR) repeat protein